VVYSPGFGRRELVFCLLQSERVVRKKDRQHMRFDSNSCLPCINPSHCLLDRFIERGKTGPDQLEFDLLSNGWPT
jgi:hypothetical protein